MSCMKKKLFLTVDFHSTVFLSPKESAQLKKWLVIASAVFEELVAEKIVPGFLGQDAHVSLMICGDSRMRSLNREHRQKDKSTDVLSFPAQEDLRSQRSLFGETLFLGDLAISWPKTQSQARAFGIGVFDEFIHLFFHGLLHLLGYDHELSAKQEKLMEEWEKRALDKFSAKKKGT